jgi:hypothetical protein
MALLRAFNAIRRSASRIISGVRWRRLALHPLEPFRPLLRRLERFGVVAGLPEDLPIAQFEDEHEVPFSPSTVVEDPLNDPQPLPYQHPAQPPGRSQSGVGILEGSHRLAAPETLSGLGPLHRVAFVAYAILRFDAEAGKELGEQAVGLLLVHLLEVGRPLLGHLCALPFVKSRGHDLPTSMLPLVEVQHICWRPMHRSAWKVNSRNFGCTVFSGVLDRGYAGSCKCTSENLPSFHELG